MAEEEREDYLTGYPNVISFNCTQEIINQMERNICRIKIGTKQGTGFFCKIPFPDTNNMLKVLVTNNHIINEDILFQEDQKIPIFIKEEKKFKILNLNNRIKFTNKKEEYDITIIEIKEEDEINNFLELDDNILNDIIKNENENDDYIDKTFYIIQYPKGELSVSYGILLKIYEDKRYKFIHKCCTEEGSSGSPILTLKNKIIGIHTGGNKLNKFGTLLSYPIKDFIKQYFNKSQNINKNIIDYKINEIFLNYFNYKFKLDLKNVNIINYYPEFQELYNYYKNKIHLQFLDSNFHKKVIEQMKKYICNISVDKCYCSGFFCKIPFPDKDNMLKVLVTTSVTIKEKILYKEDQIIDIYMDNRHICIKLNLNNRLKFICKESEITIIEINEENDNIHHFLELDDIILNDIIYDSDGIEEYIGNEVYLIQYPKGILSISFGMIKNNKEKPLFVHTCGDNYGSIGSPILGLNNKVIGIDYYHRKQLIGYFLNNPIKELIKDKFWNNINNQKNSIIKEIKNILPIQDNKIRYFNIIKKNPDLYKKLNELYLYLKNYFEFSEFRKYQYLSFSEYKTILTQMENDVHKISIGNKESIGFFCKIQLSKENENIHVLITNNSIINEEILKMKDSKIFIEIQGENKNKEITVSNRKIYTSKKYNTTIIEIKKEDKINNYLELELGYGNFNYMNYYEDKTIYMINNILGVSTVTFSYIKYVQDEDKNYSFVFNSNKNILTERAPIFMSNNKIIGIIKDKSDFKTLEGIFLIFPIREYLKRYYDSSL